MASVMWFRRDLRLADNPALLAAARRRTGAAAVRARPGTVGPRRPAAPRLPRRLAARPRRRLRAVGSRRAPGDPVAGWSLAAQEVGADRVHVAADYGPYGRQRDAAVERALAEHGIELVRTGSPYAVAPGRVDHGRGRPLQGLHAVQPGLGRARLARPGRRADRRRLGWRSTETADLPDPALPAGLELPEAGEAAARAALGGVPRPGRRLRRGPRPARRRRHLADVGAPQVGRDPPAHDARRPGRLRSAGAATYRKELAWREFYADVLSARPETAPRLPAPRVRPDAATTTRAPSSRPGRRAAPASRSSTPGCASCAPPAGCTTGSG